MLLLADVAARHRRAAVGVGDRLALEADLLVAHRDGLRDVLGHDMLAQPRPAGLDLLGADVQPLLGPGHRVVGGRPGGVTALGVAEVPVVVGGVQGAVHVDGGLAFHVSSCTLMGSDARPK